MNTVFRDKDWLYEQYITKNRTIKSIYEECGVSHNTIESYLKKYGIRKTNVATPPTKDELFQLHHIQGYGIRKISSMYSGIGEGTILKLMREYNIKVLSPNELKKIWWENPKNKDKMSDLRIKLWEDDEYRSKTSIHLKDENSINDRAIKFSATYQGIDVDEWNGFLTPERIRIRDSAKYKLWRNAVFERDNYTCMCCGDRSRKGYPVILHAHHIDCFSDNDDKRFELDNGITLCYKCHDNRSEGSFHNIYGTRHNNRNQLDEYIRFMNGDQKYADKSYEEKEKL